MHDLVLLHGQNPLFPSIQILHDILLVADIMVEQPTTDTGIEPFAVVGDLVDAEHSALLGHTVAVEPLGFGCTVVSA